MATNKQKVIEILKSRDDYNESQLLLIDELFYCAQTAKQAKREIKERGIVVNGNNGPIRNPAILIYNSAVQNMVNLAKSLRLHTSKAPADKTKAADLSIMDLINSADD